MHRSLVPDVLSRATRREIKLLMSTDADSGEIVDQETFILEGNSLSLDDQISLRQMLEIGLRGLTPREERVLRLRYGLAGVGCHTFHEIGIQFDTTPERVRQLEMSAHRKLITQWRKRELWSSRDTRRRESNMRRRQLKSKPPVVPPKAPINDTEGHRFPSPGEVSHNVDQGHIAEQQLRPVHVEAAVSHVRPRQSLFSRTWNWVPGGRVDGDDFGLASLLSSRRR